MCRIKLQREAFLKKASLFFIFLTAISCAHPEKTADKAVAPPAQATSEVATEEQKLLEKYSFEEINQVAHYSSSLVIEDVESRSEKRKKKTLLKCDPAIETANVWSMQTKALIDIKLETEKLAYLKRAVGERTKDQKYLQCQKTCACGAYASLLEKIDPTLIQDEDLKLIQFLKKEHPATSDKQSQTCVKKTAWFCDSELKQYLEKQANTVF